MAIRKRILGRKNVENTGLTTSQGAKYARFINKNGKPNVYMEGARFSDRYSVYNFLINIPNWKFILLVFSFYTAINTLFALLYYFFCLPHLQGLIGNTPFEKFEEAYFFSSQTLTTVGYGRISPVGFVTNTIASLEALIGILTLAIITGLLYGRFVKPKAYVHFSDKALIAPFKEGKALMFRLSPIKNAVLSELSVTVNAGMMVEENEKKSYKYFELPLQINSINTLFLSWTIVHPIDDNSPLQGLSLTDLTEADFEAMVYLRAFDEDFSNTVVARTSYTPGEIIEGAKFKPMFIDSPEGKGTLLKPEMINAYEMVD